MTSGFEGERAYEHIRRLSVDIGPRSMGSVGDAAAAEYIRSCFSALGLEPREQQFEIDSGTVLESRLEVLDPPLGEIPCRTVLQTADTPAEGIIGELVLVEGTKPPQVGPHLKGKVVLWWADSLDYVRSRRELAQYQPLAVLCVSWSPGMPPPHLQATRVSMQPFGPVTTLFVTLEDGLRMAQAGAKRVRVWSRSDVHRATTSNVIADLPGSLHPEEVIVVGGHRDTMPAVPGASDNASGVGVVLELARLFAQRGSSRTLRFVAWGGETAGIQGSRFYVREMVRASRVQSASPQYPVYRPRTEWERHLFNVSADVVGTALGSSKCFVFGSQGIVSVLNHMAGELGAPIEAKCGFYGSDHQSFAAARVPAICLTRTGMPYGCGPADTIDLIHPGQLEVAGRYLDLFLSRTAADAEVFPFERAVPADIVEELREIMRRRGEPEDGLTTD